MIESEYDEPARFGHSGVGGFDDESSSSALEGFTTIQRNHSKSSEAFLRYQH